MAFQRKRIIKAPATAATHVLRSKNSSIYPCAQIEELVDRVAETKRRGEEAAEERPGDSENRREDDSDALAAGHDRFRDHPGEKSEHDPGDDAHAVGLSRSTTVVF
jgi:hypothetical protein